MKAILHIGYEKTGTTAIQDFLRRNRAALRARGVLYPRSLGEENHVLLAAHAQDDDGPESLRRFVPLPIATPGDLQLFRELVAFLLAAEAREAACPVAVLSNEHCSSRLRTPGEVARLRDLLTGVFDEVEVIVYLRRQDELLLSAYSTNVKSGSAAPPLSRPLEGLARFYDWSALLRLWSGAFDRVTPRLYGRDVVGDFCAVAGIDPDGLAPPERRNESLDAARLEFLRRLNARLPGAGARGDAGRRELVAALEALSTGPRPGLPVEALDRMMELSRPGNARVAERWFGGRRGGPFDPLFGRRPPAGAVRPAGELGLDEAMDTAAGLWRAAAERVEALEAENARLRRDARGG